MKTKIKLDFYLENTTGGNQLVLCIDNVDNTEKLINRYQQPLGLIKDIKLDKKI